MHEQGETNETHKRGDGGTKRTNREGRNKMHEQNSKLLWTDERTHTKRFIKRWWPPKNIRFLLLHKWIRISSRDLQFWAVGLGLLTLSGAMTKTFGWA